MSIETRIERVQIDRDFSRRLDEWKQMHADGWAVVVLAEERVEHGRRRDTGEAVVLAWRERPS